MLTNCFKTKLISLHNRLKSFLYRQWMVKMPNIKYLLLLMGFLVVSSITYSLIDLICLSEKVGNTSNPQTLKLYQTYIISGFICLWAIILSSLRYFLSKKYQ